MKQYCLAAMAASLAIVSAFAQGTEAQSVSIKAFTKSANQILMVRPSLEAESSDAQLPGCTERARECPAHAVVAGLTRSASIGQRLAIQVDGDGQSGEVHVVVNGTEAASLENAVLPVSLPEIELRDAGTVHVFAQFGEAKSELHFSIEGNVPSPKAQQVFATATPTSSIFRFITEVPEEGNWEVIPGSGTGGRLVYTSTRCFDPAIPLWACPPQLVYFGYTDRAERGETVRTRVGFSGVASRLGVIINGRVRGQWTNVPLPVIVPQTVSPSPTDDNIFVFAVINGVYVERRLPVGTRPF